MEINSKKVQITKGIDNTDDNVVKFEYTTPQDEIDEHYFIFKTDTDKNFNDDDLIMYRINLIPGLQINNFPENGDKYPSEPL